MDNAEFIDTAYSVVLGRKADPTGRAAWTERLKTEPQHRLIASLIGSDEFRRHYVFAQVQANRDKTIASLSNHMAFAAIAVSLHKLRCDMVRRLLPRADAVLDLGGASADQQGALLAMGYRGAKRITIIDLPPDIRFKSALETNVASVHHGTHVNYAYHSMADLAHYPDASFDFVWSGETIEHVTREDGERIFRDVGRILKPGGIFALDTPNRTGTRLAVGDTGFIHAEHKYEYRFEELTEAMQSSGLELIEWKGLIDVKESIKAGYLLPHEIIHGTINDTPETSIIFYVEYRKPFG
ncbi:methyltransferase domain-containing protein [Acidisphaera sp. L21]|uniref:methyltransferase domain-containing protein n=1 Tax=Acidisphaera sp. L21 TaxID=1641851 RepID=UPI00131B8730|nr:methyltransferase domain-containing protein [Acidisphaera sp. L21]